MERAVEKPDELRTAARIARRRALLMKDLTRMVWYQLHWYHEEQGIAPSYRELAALCNCSTTAITNHLDRLERAGVVETGLGRPRATRLLLPFPSLTTGALPTPELVPEEVVRRRRGEREDW